jgi:hypothetical protein
MASSSGMVVNASSKILRHLSELLFFSTLL